MQPDRTQAHRTDLRRGTKVRVAPGVFERAGRFLITYIGPDGKEHLSTLPPGTTKTDAVAAREKTRVDVRSGDAVTPSKLTFGQVADEFLAMFESLVLSGEKSQRTLDLYQQQRRTHLSRFDRVPIQRFRAAHLASLLSELRAQGKSAWTVAGVLKLAGMILGHAFTRGLINENPVKRLSRMERPKTKQRAENRRVLTTTEITMLLNAPVPEGEKPIGAVYVLLLTVAVFTGLRQSELLGLRWQDVDADNRVLRVRHQLSRSRPWKLLPLKTDAGARDVELRPAVLRALKEHRERVFAHGLAKPEDFVFSTVTGQPLYYRNASVRGLDKSAERAGLNSDPEKAKLAFHDLRRTFGSHLVRSGADAVKLAGQMGHKKPSLLLDVYAHDFAEASRDGELRKRLDASGFGV